MSHVVLNVVHRLRVLANRFVGVNSLISRLLNFVVGLPGKSSKAESLVITTAHRTSTFLHRLQRSLERSLLTSALFSGVVTTLVLLIIALQVY